MISSNGIFGRVNEVNGQKQCTNFFFSHLPLFPKNAVLWTGKTVNSLYLDLPGSKLSKKSIIYAYGRSLLWIPLLWWITVFVFKSNTGAIISLILTVGGILFFHFTGFRESKERQRRRMVLDNFLDINFLPLDIAFNLRLAIFVKLQKEYKEKFDNQSFDTVSKNENLRQNDILFLMAYAQYAYTFEELEIYEVFVEKNLSRSLLLEIDIINVHSNSNKAFKFNDVDCEQIFSMHTKKLWLTQFAMLAYILILISIIMLIKYSTIDSVGIWTLSIFCLILNLTIFLSVILPDLRKIKHDFLYENFNSIAGNIRLKKSSSYMLTPIEYNLYLSDSYNGVSALKVLINQYEKLEIDKDYIFYIGMTSHVLLSAYDVERNEMILFDN